MNFPKYKITYLKQGFIQYKCLISHKEYLDIIKPNRQIIDRFLSEKELKSEFKTVKKEEFEESSNILKNYPEFWFTDKSPLFEAINTGILELLDTQGGNHNIKLELI